MATPTTPLKRRWFQFSLRTLFGFVTLCAIACSWLAVKMRDAERQRKAVEAVRRLGGDITYDWRRDAKGNYPFRPRPPAPEWLRNSLGEDLFGIVREVRLNRTKATDDDLECLNELKGQLDCLEFGETRITDAWLEHLKEFDRLDRLVLLGAQITDAGLVHLKGLNRFKAINLCNTKISDAGLVHLKGLAQLEFLDLSWTKVGDAGLEHLKELKQLNTLWLMGTQITDRGLKHLTGLKGLKGLVLVRTQITDEGCEHLKGLSQLQYLSLENTKVTDEGVKRLQQALPNCAIGRSSPQSR